MTIDRGRISALLDEFYGLFDSGDTSRARSLFAEDWKNHPADPGRTADVSGFLDGIADLRRALEGLTVARHTTVVDGDHAVCRITVSGRHVGVFAGYPPTGRRSHFEAMDMHRFSGDSIAETWHFERLETLSDPRS